MTEEKKKKTIAFDFDGVIANYNGFVSREHREEPITETVKAIKLLQEKGFNILIHSSRGDDFLRSYLEGYQIPYDYINHNPNKQGDNPGKPLAHVYIDDRAISFRGQKAEDLVSEIENFKAHWE